MPSPEHFTRHDLLRKLENIEAQWTHDCTHDSHGVALIGGHQGLHHADHASGRTWCVRTAISGAKAVVYVIIVREIALPDLDLVFPKLFGICEHVALQAGASAIESSMGISHADTVFSTSFGLPLLDGQATADVAAACECYRRAFDLAWGPAPFHHRYLETGRHFDPADAGMAQTGFAEGHVMLISAFFKAVSCYLCSGTGRPSTLLDQIRSSPRLAGPMDQWLSRLLTMPEAAA